jgi:hypothetical protein
MMIFRIGSLLLAIFLAFLLGQGRHDGGANVAGFFALSVILLASVGLYLLPTYEAWRNKHPNAASIALLNVFLGWSLIGWVVSLVWAFKHQDAPAPMMTPRAAQPLSVTDELEKLASLLERGILTQQEFEQQKRAILAR